jgi:formylglycine-generating enzyme required for sulfatase activity/predicted ATPase
MSPTHWLQEARQRLARLAQTIDDWAPSTLYGAIASAAILPVVAAGDPKTALAGLIGGVGANLIANQLETWRARSQDDAAALAKQVSEAAKADTPLRESLDDLLQRIDALAVVIHHTAEAERAATVQQLTRQFARLNSRLNPEQIYVGGDWVTIRDIKDSYVAVGNDIVIAGPGAHVGDVVYHHHPLPADEAAQTARRQAYLQHLYSEARRLSLAGIDRKAASDEGEATIPLDAIYTALLTTETDDETVEPRTDRKPQRLSAVAQPNRHTRLVLLGDPGVGKSTFINWETDDERVEQRTNQEPQRLSAVAQLNRHNRLVLLGAPGGGKSTFVNFVALCLAGEELGEAAVNLDLLTTPLPTDGNREDAPRQPWEHGGLLPVRVVLRHFAAQGLPAPGEKAGADHLWQHICRDLAAASLGEFAEDLKAELRQRGGLVLLDGLDEVPDADQQRAQLKATISAFAGAYRRCRIVITSRPYAYRQEEWRLDGFAAATLAPFSAAQIARFVEQWYRQVAPLRHYQADDAQGRAKQLKTAILRNERLWVLAEQPLLLTLMASLHAWHGGTLPDKRERLYAEAVDLLLERWEQQRVERRRDGTQLAHPSLQEYLQVGRDAILSVLERLAYEVHASQPQLVGCADIRRDLLISALLAISNNPQVRPLALINYLSQRAGLLLPEGNTLYRFPHRTFQEYLAARYLTSAGVEYPDRIADLVRADPSRWREVALLAAAKAADGIGSSIWGLVDALCQAAPDEASFERADAWGAHLAGQALVESAKLEQLNVPNQRKLGRVRHGLLHVLGAADFPPVERALAGRTLATLGDPRFDPHAWYLPVDPLLGFVEIPAGPFIMGSDPQIDKEADKDETPQHEVDLPTFYIARYPVTVGQFRAFVTSTGEQPQDADSLADPDNHPVRWVTWVEATRYCAWLTETLRAWPQTPEPLAQKLALGWRIMLPSEAEWEKAARGSNGNRYPWGHDPVDPSRANYAATGLATTSAVGCFPSGATPTGIYELSGNVWEWTRSLYQAYRYPNEAFKRGERERLQDQNRDEFVLRGGNYYSDEETMRAPLREYYYSDLRYDDGGFRLVWFAPPGS